MKYKVTMPEKIYPYLGIETTSRGSIYIALIISPTTAVYVYSSEIGLCHNKIILNDANQEKHYQVFTGKVTLSN
jgi:hypothetical protein